MNVRSATLFTLCFMAWAIAPTARGQDASTTFRERVQPILAKHCADCHSGARPKAELDLAGPRPLDRLRGEGRHWFRVLDQVESGAMPPKDSDPLSPAEKQTLARWIRGEFSELLLDQQRREGRSRMRRLSRQEYANTIQDVFGIRPPVVRVLPADGRVDGYDKVSAALPFSAAATEGHLKMAEDLVTQLMQLPTGKINYRLWSAPSEQSAGHVLVLPDDWHVSFNTDTTSSPLRKERKGFPGPRKPGWHRLRISAYGYQTDQPMAVGIYVGHVWAYPQILDLVKVIEVPPRVASVIETEVYLRTGRDSDGPSDDGIRLIPFGLGVQVPKNTQASACKGPGLALQWVDVEEMEESLPGQQLLKGDIPEALREAFEHAGKGKKVPREALQAFFEERLGRIGARLFRRDLTPAQLAAVVEPAVKSVEGGAALKTALGEGVVSLLVSPDFLCVIEQPGPLDDFALAARLSYFLWSSAPDEELLKAAREKQLTKPAALRQQTERLLADPKSERFVKDFLNQWLGLWGIDNTTPDKDLYPEFDDLLKHSSVLETQATFRHMLDKDRTVRDLVAPSWAMLNGRLAAHYQLPSVEGFALREVKLPAETPFGGMWTQASTMKVTANGTLTSPVKRGVWVAERLLGVSIPPPPPNIDPVDPDTRGAKTLREQLALHSGKGSCAACHARFDPYGFALESFDVMGALRTHYRIANPEKGKGISKWKEGLPVDSSGVTPDGKPFAGVQELRKQLSQRPEQLAHGVVRHLTTYGTGEPPAAVDRARLDAIVASTAKQDYGLRSLVHAVVQSELFRNK